jgi:hypothetical protein
MTDSDSRRQVATCYEKFPQDGKLHWLRWLDGIDIRGHGSGSPVIHAHLSPLADLPDGRHMPTLQEVAAAPGLIICPVHVASLPDLLLGTVFKDGVQIDTLKMVQRTFAFDRSTCSSTLLRCYHGSPAPKPSWWKLKWSVLPESAYALKGARHSFCLVLQKHNRQLIIPVSEVFRTFCGPESRLAEALLSGPWESVRNRIVNPSWTEQFPDRWEIGLRTGLTGRSALPAAAFELTDYGRSIAGLIHSQLVNSSSGTRDLKADIPYEWDTMELDVEGVAFPSNIQECINLDRFLCLKIIGVRWTKPLANLPPGLVYRLDNNNTFKDQNPSPPVVGRPSGTKPGPTPDPVDGTVPISPDTAASENVERLVSLVQPAPPIVGGPVITRMDLEESEGTPRKRLPTPPGDPATHTSPTQEGPGDKGAAPLRHVPGATTSPTGFGEIASALVRLRAAGSIMGWDPLPPKNDKAAFREGFPAWCFPGFDNSRRIAWAYTEASRRRTALVVRIALADHIFYLLEIERRIRPDGTISEAFNMLLLYTAETNVQDTVAALLRLAGGQKGVWPVDVAFLANNTGAHTGRFGISRRRHYYNLASGSMPGVQEARQLDSDRLIDWIGQFLVAAPA